MTISLNNFAGWLGTTLGAGGLALLLRYLVEVIISRRRREADTETVRLQNDAKRVEMADTIIEHYKNTMEVLQHEVQNLKDESILQRVTELALRERVDILEKTLLLHGISIPPYTHKEPNV